MQPLSVRVGVQAVLLEVELAPEVELELELELELDEVPELELELVLDVLLSEPPPQPTNVSAPSELSIRRRASSISVVVLFIMYPVPGMDRR